MSVTLQFDEFSYKLGAQKEKKIYVRKKEKKNL